MNQLNQDFKPKVKNAWYGPKIKTLTNREISNATQLKKTLPNSLRNISTLNVLKNNSERDMIQFSHQYITDFANSRIQHDEEDTVQDEEENSTSDRKNQDSFVPLKLSSYFPTKISLSNNHTSDIKHHPTLQSQMTKNKPNTLSKERENDLDTTNNITHNFQSQDSRITKFCRISKRKTTKLRDTIGKNQIIIFSDDPWKLKWDITITICLMYTALVTPFRISFFDTESLGWLIAEYCLIGIFSIDIFFNFLTAYYDSDDNLIIEKKKIALNYLRTWFIVDLISAFPIIILTELGTNYGTLSRLAKLPRLYRLIKMSKILRMLKIIKERKKITLYFSSFAKISSGLERLFFIVFGFILFIHLSSCFWYFMSRMDEFNPDTWVVRAELMNASHFEIYVSCLYFILTTITSVGYGDIHPLKLSEKLFASTIMVIGVCFISYASGSLTSVITNMDSKKAKLMKKLNTLEELKKQYGLDPEIYIRLKKVLKYDHSRNETEKIDFIKELPQSLKLELAIIMHQNIINKIPFFQNREAHIVGYIGPMLRPVKVFKGQYVYMEGHPIDDIYFLVKGKAAVVLTKENDLPFVLISKGYYFGETDILNIDNEKRMFTVKAMTDCELLALNKTDLEKIQEEFPEIISELFQMGETRLHQIIELQERANKFVAYKNSRTQRIKRSKPMFPFQRSLRYLDQLSETSNIPKLSSIPSQETLEVNPDQDQNSSRPITKTISSSNISAYQKLKPKYNEGAESTPHKKSKFAVHYVKKSESQYSSFCIRKKKSKKSVLQAIRKNIADFTKTQQNRQNDLFENNRNVYRHTHNWDTVEEKIDPTIPDTRRGLTQDPEESISSPNFYLNQGEDQESSSISPNTMIENEVSGYNMDQLSFSSLLHQNQEMLRSDQINPNQILGINSKLRSNSLQKPKKKNSII